MSEFDWIDRYLRPIVRAPGASGLTNDVAVLRSDGPVIATMDTIVEGVHFLSTDPIETVAKKLLRVNVSDILCKGAVPRDALLSCAWPAEFSESDFAGFCRALGEDLKQLKTSLVGGDMVRTPGPLTLTMTLTGRCLADGPVSRSGAQRGDIVCVTGEIGHAGFGLEDTRRGRDTAAADRYRVPVLPGREIAALVAQFATASIDISDGLLSDTAHIARTSGTGIALRLEDVPFAQAAHTAEYALQQATSGDDYQTLFTLPSERKEACLEAAQRSGLQLSVIGTVTHGSSVSLSFNGKPVPLPSRSGYTH